MESRSASDPNYFELLGIEPSPLIDEEQLERNYLEKSREVHPDRLGLDADQDLALQASAQLNEAFTTLKSAWARFPYYLELRQPGLLAENREMTAEKLAEAMELGEEVEQARPDVQRKNELDKELRARLERLEQEVETLLDSGDDLPCAARLCYEAKYLQRAIENLQRQGDPLL